MNDNWDSYFCTVDEKPASVVVNLALGEEEDLAAFPALCYVSLFLRKPDAEGFPDDEEEALLAEMEDALVESFHAPDTGRCAGHCLTDGRLDVFFYMESGENWQENAAAVLDRYPSREWEAGSHEDPEWELFFGFLYPDETSMLLIQNRRACERLEELGHDLSVSRRIEHWAIFPDREKAEAYALTAKEMGYAAEQIEETELAANGEEDAPAAGENAAPVWQVLLSRPDRPDDCDEVSLLLFGLAREQGGEYMGWSCSKLQE